MKTRILTAIAIIAVILPPVFFGGWLLWCLCAFIVAAGSYEYLHALDGYSRWGIFLTPVMILWILAMAILPEKFLFAWWIIGIVFFWSMPVFTETVSERTALSIVAFAAVFGLCMLSMCLLIPQHKYLWTLCLATYGSDTGAYFSGRFLGRHKMNTRISPKKTWEGFFGGLVFGFLLSWGVSFLYVNDLNWTVNILICLLAPAAAELGDLCFSAFKRAYGIKDFSNLLPGHGGVLDRVDSLLMNFLLFGILITIL